MRRLPFAFALLTLLGTIYAQSSEPPKPASNDLAQVGAYTTLEARELLVPLAKSIIIDLQTPVERVSVANPEIAEIVVISPQQIQINGKAAGDTTLLIWDRAGNRTAFDLVVHIDVSQIRAKLKESFPAEQITVTAAKDAVMLSGTASSEAVAKRAIEIAQAFTKNIVNLLQVPHKEEEQILLQVRFAEVDRSAFQELGINIMSTGALNTPGAISTQQFAPPRGGSGPGVAGGGVIGGAAGAGAGGITGTIGAPLSGTSTFFTLGDILNIFAFRPDVNLGVTIRALQAKNLLQILAEPNLLAYNGKEASFLAGGEFPFPAIQAGIAGAGVVTVQFREFGIRLNFTPTITPTGSIHMKVRPEVSSLDFANALVIGGFAVPALTTRRAETEIELKDGQSFVIAGLLDNRLTEQYAKIPVLGDIPILGHLFRSRILRKSNTELLVLVTPKLVKPLNPDQLPPLPEREKPFLREEKRPPSPYPPKGFEGPVGHQDRPKN